MHLSDVANLEPGQHLCWLYDTEDEHRAVLVPFVRRGLDLGDKVVYLACAHVPRTIAGYLADDGIDVDAYLSSGQLSILEADQVYLRGGRFDPGGVIAWIEEQAGNAQRDGYRSLRISGEMTWALSRRPGCELLVEYESRLNECFDSMACIALCQYDRRRFDAAVLNQVLVTHPDVLIGTELCHNLSWVPPQEYLSELRPLALLTYRMEDMVAHARLRRELETRVEERTAELREVNAALKAEIEERRRTEEALRDKEEWVRCLIDQSSDGIVMVDASGTVIEWNQGQEQITGVSREGALGRTIWDVEFLFEPPDERTAENYERLRANIRQVLQDGDGSWMGRRVEREFQRLDGTRGYMESVAFPVRARQGLVIGSVSRDTTVRRQAEEVLRLRTEQLEALREVGLSLAVQLDLDSLLKSIVVWAIRLVGAQSGGFYLNRTQDGEAVLEWAVSVGNTFLPLGTRVSRGEGLSGRAWEEGRPLVVDNYPTWEGRLPSEGGYGFAATAAVPVCWHGELLGMLNVMAKEAGALARTEVELLSLFAAHAAAAIANARLFDAVQRQREQLRSLTARLAEIEEAERQRLAHELHDQVGQNLSVLGINLNIIRSQMLPDTATTTASRFADSLALIEETTARIRNIMADLRPPVLDDYGLPAALRWYAEQLAARTGLDVQVSTNGSTERLPPALENSLFRIAQEALTNVAKHACAKCAEVTLQMAKGKVRLTVVDDGVGFEPGVAAGTDRQGWGLLGMTERAQSLEGHLNVDSQPGAGTCVCVEVPVP